MKTLRSQQVCLIALLWFSNIAAVNAASLDQFLDLDLEELANYQVVTPTKAGMPLSDAPGAVTLITYDQIRRSSATTIPELLRLVPGVNVRWNPMVQTIDIRSYGSNPFTSKVLLLIDGIPYNSWNKGGFPQHPGFDFFNIENVKHLEVVRGPGSALYGENALNGVINIVTLSGEEFRQTSASIYGGDRNTRSYNITHGSKIGENGSIFASIRKTEGQLPSEIWRDTADADAEAVDLFIKAKYKGWQASFYRRDDSFEGYSNIPTDLPGATFRTADEIEQTVNIISTQFDHKADNGAWSFQANASYSNRDGSHCAACHAPQQNASFENPEDHGYQAFGSAQLGIHNLGNHELLIGAEIRRISAGDHEHELSGANTLDSDHEDGHNHGGDITAYNKHALFVQGNLSFLDEKLNVVVGTRYDSETSPGLLGSELFPRIAIVAKPTDKLTLRAGWNKAARYPSFAELYQASWFLSVETPEGPMPLADFHPNDDLQPEHIESFELGVAYDFSRHLQGRLDFFQNDIEHSIVVSYPSAPGAGGIGFENHPNDARIRGFEAELQAIPSPELSAFINWSYQDNKEKGSGTTSQGFPLEFSYAPRHKINAGVTWKPAEALSTTLDVSWRDKHKAPMFWAALEHGDPTANTLDDYTYVNLNVQYRLPFVVSGGKRPLTLSLYGKNLGNERPEETLSGVGGPMPGREFYMRLEYDWTL